MINGRISKEEMFMRMAEVVASRSTCQRRHVGAIVTDAEGYSAVSLGYNGNAKGLDNACDRDTPGDCGCIHAEVNALIKSPFHQGDLVMYTVAYPCIDCAKLILNSRVKRVYFREPYRLDEGAKLLLSQGIEMYRLALGSAYELISVNSEIKEYTEAGQTAPAYQSGPHVDSHADVGASRGQDHIDTHQDHSDMHRT